MTNRRYFAYRAYGSSNSIPHTWEDDQTTGCGWSGSPKPMGQVLAFGRKTERDAFVVQGYQMVKSVDGYQYHSLSHISAVEARNILERQFAFCQGNSFEQIRIEDGTCSDCGFPSDRYKVPNSPDYCRCEYVYGHSVTCTCLTCQRNIQTPRRFSPEFALCQ